ncbi:MAG: hypothetical protein AB1806_00330 [Acidobacteriota bacterium]
MTEPWLEATRPGQTGYSPKSRTALILTGAGTAGAYHAGVLRALGEAGVRVDLVAGQGIGVVGAYFAAIDGASRLWGADGLWRSGEVVSLYRWRAALRWLAWGAGAALAVVAVPLVALAAGLGVFVVAFLGSLVGLSASEQISDRYTAIVHDLFLPGRLPAWVAQAAVFLLAVVFIILLIAAMRGAPKGRHRERGRFWWRVLGAPLSARGAVGASRRALWRLIAGGARVAEPDALELSHRYAELLADNLGQPGFRELIVLVHDLDTRRDLIGAALGEAYRQGFFGRRHGAGAWPARAGEALDLAGMDRDHVMDVLAAALSVPVVNEPSSLTFSPEGYWRGETHRVCDRPGSVARLLEEVSAAGAEQVIVVSASAALEEPHTLEVLRIDGRGKVGAWLAAQEMASTRDAVRARASSFRNVHWIRPAHNPVGPFGFGGVFDERSDRMLSIGELVDRGYEDAFRQFIEPVVGGTDQA